MLKSNKLNVCMCFSHENDAIYLLLLEDLFIEKLFTEGA